MSDIKVTAGGVVGMRRQLGCFILGIGASMAIGIGATRGTQTEGTWVASWSMFDFRPVCFSEFVDGPIDCLRQLSGPDLLAHASTPTWAAGQSLAKGVIIERTFWFRSDYIDLEQRGHKLIAHVKDRKVIVQREGE